MEDTNIFGICKMQGFFVLESFLFLFDVNSKARENTSLLHTGPLDQNPLFLNVILRIYQRFARRKTDSYHKYES